ncbi:uncharacterized protein LOC126378870 isoform X2 [Pectinophora gossypiella]|uniref:uncharacterized protein LOC126378870 isoform X2 n=1 Tax=Pectinophora gossypiella TaxID=13191 RepID=UPI00214EC0D8|nr:uncharacterized protein LOC126378870 isoform X2 [Pectinophora gossypiella]
MYRPASTWGRKPYPTKNQTRLGDNRRPDYHTWKSTATTTSVRAEAATALAEQFYMDDLIFGGDDEQRVTEVAHEIYRILKGANFHLCKWKSNSLYIQGLDSEAFLAAFRRFTARRGKPRRMMYQSFWRGWSRDYIGTLQQRTKWRSSKGPSLTVGTVVLIKDDHLPPCYWKLARITDTHAGRDGIVRVATMKTSTGNIIKRSFAKICPLPISLE